MTTTTDALSDLNITTEIDIDASIEVAFEALVEQLGPSNEAPDGSSMSLRFEPWPGGRWYRDLGDDNGHLWGHVQVIKRPTLIEITGPLFMSYPVASHIRYRLAESGGGTRLTLTHRAVGMIDPDHRTGVKDGWGHMLASIKTRAESA